MHLYVAHVQCLYTAAKGSTWPSLIAEWSLAFLFHSTLTWLTVLLLPTCLFLTCLLIALVLLFLKVWSLLLTRTWHYEITPDCWFSPLPATNLGLSLYHPPDSKLSTPFYGLLTSALCLVISYLHQDPSMQFQLICSCQQWYPSIVHRVTCCSYQAQMEKYESLSLPPQSPIRYKTVILYCTSYNLISGTELTVVFGWCHSFTHCSSIEMLRWPFTKKALVPYTLWPCTSMFSFCCTLFLFFVYFNLFSLRRCFKFNVLKFNKNTLKKLKKC